METIQGDSLYIQKLSSSEDALFTNFNVEVVRAAKVTLEIGNRCLPSAKTGFAANWLRGSANKRGCILNQSGTYMDTPLTCVCSDVDGQL